MAPCSATRQLLIQATALLAAIVYSGVVSAILLKMIGSVIPLKISAEDESVGLDVSQHGEEAYIYAEGSTLAAVGLGLQGSIPRLKSAEIGS